jgi:hypothetical protein
MMTHLNTLETRRNLGFSTERNLVMCADSQDGWVACYRHVSILLYDCMIYGTLLDGLPVPPSSRFYNNVAHLFKARTVKPKKQLLLGNGCVKLNSGVTVGICVLCAVRAEAV